MNLTLQELREKVDALSHLHPLTPTNCPGVRVDAGTVYVLLDEDGERAAELAEAKQELANSAKELTELEEKLNALDMENDANRTLLAALKDPESGVTVQQFKERAEAAERVAEEAAKNSRQWQVEIEALRKRKGVTAGYFKHRGEIIRFVDDIASARLDRATEKAKKIMEAMAFA